jgi:hypothetical protein
VEQHLRETINELTVAIRVVMTKQVNDTPSFRYTSSDVSLISAPVELFGPEG